MDQPLPPPITRNPLLVAPPIVVERAAPNADSAPADDALKSIVGATPPWLVSVMVHASLVILLGLAAVEVHRDAQEEMAVSIEPPVELDDYQDEIFAETLGEQLEVETPGITPEDLSAPVDTEYSLSALPPVDDPFAAPAKALESEGPGPAMFSDVAAPAIGLALTGREEGRKDALLKAYGGTRTTQQAVESALAWLVRQQQRDGSWSLSGPYANGAHAENKAAATAMALIAFAGDGHTQMRGTHQRAVQRGLRALLKMQNADGAFFSELDSPHHRLYAHAQCTIAVCELYGMTQDSEIRDAAERAARYCTMIQSPEGGWRYVPMQDADVSVSGWFVMALQSARMAKLAVPQQTLDRVGEFLDAASSHSGSRYAYQIGRVDTPPMTAEALLCRQYLGWPRDDKRLARGVEYLARFPVDWENRNVYHWYYATQVMHHMGGEPWVAWNRVMRQVVPERQLRSGPERGSWDPVGDQWGAAAGRLYVTCLSTYLLEVYYRHLPLFN